MAHLQQNNNNNEGPPDCTIQDALFLLNPAIRKEDDKLAQVARREWRKLFSDFKRGSWHAAKSALKPPQLRAAFSAHTMRADWNKHWCPATDGSRQATDAWRQFAADTNFPNPPNPVRVEAPQGPRVELPNSPRIREQIISRKDFAEALLGAKGSAGFDGWTAHEAACLQRYFPSLADELFCLWQDTMELCNSSDDLPQDLALQLWSWRVVGVPKKSEYDSRPISVGSVLVRAWHRAMLSCCPAPPVGQWCGKKNSSVVKATADFFAANTVHVAETDLSKAFDHLWPSLAEVALVQLGTPPPVASTLRRAWQGPRFCTVSGTIANPINPIRGIPQGCPCSPLGLAATLGPWSLGVEMLDPLIKSWAFMDDRTIGILQQGSRELLRRGFQFTQNFDRKVGFEINPDKTQIYFHGSRDLITMEHLGLKHNLADPHGPILPRDAVKREDVVDRLFTCPGTIQVRSKLATAFVRPLEDWASPFMSPGSQDQVKSLFRAITHATTKWWCYGRFWCQQVENHPAFGVAIRGLCNGPGLLSSASRQLSAALARHASVLCLRVVRTTPQPLWVKTTRPPASLGIPLRDGLATFNQETQIDVDNCGHGSNIRHALRTRARRMLLSRINRSRFDCEGVEDIDVDCTRHKVWCDWIKSLSPPDTTALCIWRSGAIWTPTRRYHRPRAPQPELTVCPFCGYEAASARHFWADCPGFNNARSELQSMHHIAASWWQSQPRCTSKSGWITRQAARTAALRAHCAVAACKLGIRIYHAVSPA